MKPLAPPPDWLAPYDARDENERLLDEVLGRHGVVDRAGISGNPIAWHRGPTGAELEGEIARVRAAALAEGMDVVTYQLREMAASFEQFRQSAERATREFERLLPQLEQRIAEERERLRLLGEVPH